MCGVVLECGCAYYGSSVDAAGGRGIVEKNKQSLATAAARVKPCLHFERKSTAHTQTILRTWGAFSRPPMPI